MITDYRSDKNEWRCTMINGGRTEEEVEAKRKDVIRRIMEDCGLRGFSDEIPGVI